MSGAESEEKNSTVKNGQAGARHRQVKLESRAWSR